MELSAGAVNGLGHSGKREGATTSTLGNDKHCKQYNNHKRTKHDKQYKRGCTRRVQALCTDVATLESVRVRLPPHWARTFWGAAAAVDLHRNAEALDKCADLARLFPRSAHLVLLGATAKYHLRDFESAEHMFEELLRADPYRIEGLDTYSNILYVKEKFASLSHLAHQVWRTLSLLERLEME